MMRDIALRVRRPPVHGEFRRGRAGAQSEGGHAVQRPDVCVVDADPARDAEEGLEEGEFVDGEEVAVWEGGLRGCLEV